MNLIAIMILLIVTGIICYKAGLDVGRARVINTIKKDTFKIDEL